MFILALMFWAIAGGLFYVGGYMFYSHGHIENISTSKYILIPASIILLVGVLVLAVGVIGIIAVFNESRCLLASFFTILTAIFALLAAACAMAVYYNKNDDLLAKITADWKSGQRLYPNDIERRDEIDYVQSMLSCCGVTNASDWLNPSLSPLWAKKHAETKDVPMSCCKNLPKNESACPLEVAKKDPGCASMLVDIIDKNLIWIFSVAAGVAIIFLVGMLASAAVMCTRREGSCVCCPAAEEYQTLNEHAAPTGGRGAGLRV